MADKRVSAIRIGIVVGLACALLGCGEGSGESTAQPVNGGQPPAALPPAVTAPPASQSFGPNQIAGEVFSAAGPVAGAGIVLWVQSPIQGWYLHRNGQLITDAAGRFSAAGLEDGAKVTVKVIDDAYKQPCAANVVAGTEETIRVELVPLGAFDLPELPRPVSARDPTLTGTVYEGVLGGNGKPLSGVHIQIDNEPVIAIASAMTDREGRYFFCNLPPEVAIRLGKSGYGPMTVSPVDTTKGIPLDIKLWPPDE